MGSAQSPFSIVHLGLCTDDDQNDVVLHRRFYTAKFRCMEWACFSSTKPNHLNSVFIANQSPLVRNFERNPTLGIPNFVELPKYSKNSRKLATRLFMATSNSGISSETAHGVRNDDGVIIVDHGSRRKESNLMLNEFVAMFVEKTGYPIVEPAHMELAEPSIRDAFSSCVKRGAKRVIVSPFFLFPGRHWYQDIPALTAEAAKDHPGVSYLVTAPLGLHGLLVDVMNERINHCLSHVAGDAEECSVCAGTGKCQLH